MDEIRRINEQTKALKDHGLDTNNKELNEELSKGGSYEGNYVVLGGDNGSTNTETRNDDSEIKNSETRGSNNVSEVKEPVVSGISQEEVHKMIQKNNDKFIMAIEGLKRNIVTLDTKITELNEKLEIEKLNKKFEEKQNLQVQYNNNNNNPQNNNNNSNNYPGNQNNDGITIREIGNNNQQNSQYSPNNNSNGNSNGQVNQQNNNSNQQNNQQNKKRQNPGEVGINPDDFAVEKMFYYGNK